MLEKIKKNWREILIGILVLFSLNKCTQSCNRSNTISNQETKIEQLDSTIKVLAADTLSKAHQIDVLYEKINTATEKANVASAKEETAKANEATAKANEGKAKAEAAAAAARAREAQMKNK